MKFSLLCLFLTCGPDKVVEKSAFFPPVNALKVYSPLPAELISSPYLMVSTNRVPYIALVDHNPHLCTENPCMIKVNTHSEMFSFKVIALESEGIYYDPNLVYRTFLFQKQITKSNTENLTFPSVDIIPVKLKNTLYLDALISPGRSNPERLLAKIEVKDFNYDYSFNQAKVPAVKTLPGKVRISLIHQHQNEILRDFFIHLDPSDIIDGDQIQKLIASQAVSS